MKSQKWLILTFTFARPCLVPVFRRCCWLDANCCYASDRAVLRDFKTLSTLCFEYVKQELWRFEVNILVFYKQLKKFYHVT